MFLKAFLLIFVFIVAFLAGVKSLKVAYAGLSCTVRTSSCSGGEVEIFEMQNTTNSHAGLPAASYNNLVCCSGVTDLGNSCSGTFATALKLSGTTNAHVQQTGSYAQSACISVPSGGSVSVGYQATNCTGFDTTLGSMSAATNAHVGDGTAYTTKICGTAAGAAPTISCSTNVSTTAFGVLTTSLVSTASPNASTTMSCSGTTAGCTLYVKDAGSGSSPGLWKSVSPTYLITSADATLSAGVDGHGIQATSTAAGSGGTLNFNSKYNKTSNNIGGLTLTNTVLASSTVDVTGREAVVTHKAAIGDTALSGSYADTITYECVAN